MQRRSEWEDKYCIPLFYGGGHKNAETFKRATALMYVKNLEKKKIINK